MPETEFIVKTAAACMPASCWGRYRRVAVLEVERGIWPTMISDRARGVVRVVQTWERLNCGKTERDAYSRAMAEAEAMTKELNHTPRWYFHTDHGFMLRIQDRDYPTHDVVVTALMQHTAELERDPATWEAHKSRLYVNGGCGAVCVDQLRRGDHNPAFTPCDAAEVPSHIRTEFLQYGA